MGGTAAATSPLFAMSGDGVDDIRIPMVFVFMEEAKKLLEFLKSESELEVTLEEKPVDVESGSSDCTCGLAQRNTKIVGGQETEVSEWPWQVGMVWSGSSSVFCGATVISDEWILTAAHCTDGTGASEIQVLMGEHDYWNNGETNMVRMDIAEIVNHENYNSNTVDNDFALLRMATKIEWGANPHIRPACLLEYGAGDYDQW